MYKINIRLHNQCTKPINNYTKKTNDLAVLMTLVTSQLNNTIQALYNYCIINIPIIMASIPRNTFPFSDLDDERFLLTIYEFQNGPIVYDQDRLSTLLFNPLLLNTKHHLAINNNLDPDENLLDEFNHTACEYYIEDQFNEIIRNECSSANLGFSTLHLNIRSISKNISRLTDWLCGLAYYIFCYWYY